MFTGIVQALGHVQENLQKKDHNQLTLKIASELELKLGSSLAVNGCCLSVSKAVSANVFQFDLSSETLARTNLGRVKSGMFVNLEPAMRLNERLDGHMVSGHVDTTARLVNLDKGKDVWTLVIAFARAYEANVIDKGSICVDGISLTINRISTTGEDVWVEVALIPVTLEKTHLRGLPGDWTFNIEFDLIGKYIQRLMGTSKNNA